MKLILAGCAFAVAAAAAGEHPDLSGTYAFGIDLPPVALKVETKQGAQVKTIDQSARWGNQKIEGALASTPAPAYKKELQAKVKDLIDHESKTDPVFYCGRPGVPRVGSPRKIVQLPNEMIFFYEDISGNTFRIIPTDGRAHRKDANPSYYGDSVGHWEGKVFVVDVTNFVEDTWFGEDGYFHSDQLHVTERLWKQGENLAGQAIVEDPKVLSAPWVMPARLVKPSTEAIDESPKCVETDAPKLVNNDHHGQR